MPHSVLIIDDEPGITSALLVRLQAAGFTAFHAINGLAGIEATRLHRPDLIVLDIRMPDIDGYEVCRHLREDEEFRHTPIIFLSGNGHDDARTRALAVGGNLFLAKPFDAADIIAAIESLLVPCTPSMIPRSCPCPRNPDHRS